MKNIDKQRRGEIVSEMGEALKVAGVMLVAMVVTSITMWFGGFWPGIWVGIACYAGLKFWSRALMDSRQRRVKSEDVARGIHMAKQGD